MKIIIHKTTVTDINIDKITDGHVKVALQKLTDNQHIDEIQKLWIYNYINTYCQTIDTLQVDTIK
jgi:hypothetical protein